MYKYILMIIFFANAQSHAQSDGHLVISSSVPMVITLNDTLEFESSRKAVSLPSGQYRLKASPLNDRNWYSKPIEAMIEIEAVDTTYISLEPDTHRMLQSVPSEALVISESDSVLGKTPYILDYNEHLLSLYLEKNGYLRKRVDFSDTDWPKIVTLQRSEELRQEIDIPTKINPVSPFKKYLKPGLVATAVASNWLSFYLKRKADDYYDQYQRTSDLDRMNHYYDQTEQYDLYSAVMLGVSTAATVTFFYLLLTDN